MATGDTNSCLGRGSTLARTVLTTLTATVVLTGTAAGCATGQSDERIETAIADSGIQSPLTYLLDIAENDLEQIRAREQEAQEDLAACMADHGFTYIPHEASPATGMSVDTGFAPTTKPETIHQHGYGIADALEHQTGNSVPPQPDPNEAIRGRLTADEQQVYDEAMSGLVPGEVVWDSETGIPLDPASGEPMSFAQYQQASSDGCLHRAYVGDDGQDEVVRLLASEAYSNLQNRIMSDDRMVDLVQAWSRCMAERGYSYRSSQEIVDQLLDEAHDIEHQIIEDHHELTEAQAEHAIAQFKANEIQLAVADLECSAELAAEAPAIVREYEVDFISDNEETIVGILDIMEHRRSTEGGTSG